MVRRHTLREDAVGNVKEATTPELFKLIRLGITEPRSLGYSFDAESALIELARRQNIYNGLADMPEGLDNDFVRKACEESSRGK
jgi:hypothetical protein